MTASLDNSLDKKIHFSPSSPHQNNQNEQIKKIFSDALIILSALAFLGTGIAWMIVPIAIAPLSIIGTSIFVAFSVGLILRSKPEALSEEYQEELTSALNSKSTTDHTEEKKEEEIFDPDTIPDLDPHKHFEEISGAFDGENSKVFFFLMNRLKFEQILQKLGQHYFNKPLLVALAHSRKLDMVAPGWEDVIIAQLSKLHGSIHTPSYPNDPNQARTEEIASFPKGLNNPSGNCFMHASLQTLFQNKEVATMLLEQLQTIAESEKYHTKQAIDPKDCTLLFENSKDQADLLAHKDAMIADLVKDRRIFEIKALASYDLAEVLKIDLSSDENLAQIYMTCSLKEAAKWSHALIAKWQSGEEISKKESTLMRLSLIKLMNRPNSIVLDKTSFLSLTTYKARWKIPGLHGDFNIRPEIHEDACLFTRNVLESLDSLSHAINPDLKESGIAIKISRKIKAFKKPAPVEEGQEEVPLFDPSLAIDGAELDYIQKLIAVHPEAKGTLFQLDDLGFLSQYQSHDKPSVTYKASENIPGTNVGDTVSERYIYKITLPTTLITSLNIFDFTKQGGTKHAQTSVKFTDDENLTITYPKSTFFDEDQTYRLDSFVVHSGTTLRAGHYFSFTRKQRSDGTSYWMKQNDNEITPCTCHEALQFLRGSTHYINPFMLIFSKV